MRYMLPTVASFAAALHGPQHVTPLRKPYYVPADTNQRKIFLAVEPFKRHMTDEGWQLQLGMEHAGFELWGPRFPGRDKDDVRAILRETSPQVCIVQDKREWDPKCHGCFDKSVGFQHAKVLQQTKHVFRLTVFKDAHQDPRYHCAAHTEFDVHAWLIYYHPTIVCRLAPWLRPEHLIRVYHTIDPAKIPEYFPHRPFDGILSGSCSDAYPLRQRLARAVRAGNLPCVFLHPHPGYHADGSHTDSYLRMLTQYKVSICTASKYGYSLRKLIESTACGCRVITNLPVDDVMPGIDENLVRVADDATPEEIGKLVAQLAADYDPERQRHFASLARDHYDYRTRFLATAQAIDDLRRNWSNVPGTAPHVPLHQKLRQLPSSSGHRAFKAVKIRTTQTRRSM